MGDSLMPHRPGYLDNSERAMWDSLFGRKTYVNDTADTSCDIFKGRKRYLNDPRAAELARLKNEVEALREEAQQLRRDMNSALLLLDALQSGEDVSADLDECMAIWEARYRG